MNALTVGKVLLVYEMSMQVFPTAPSPTVTHLINLDALMLKKLSLTNLKSFSKQIILSDRKRRDHQK